MSFLAPGFLVAAGAVAAGIVTLHFIVTREPRTVPLPTARFAPERPVAARTRVLKLADLPLLLCRVALVLLAGAALARPVLAPARRPLARIVLVDQSHAGANLREAADSARALAGPAGIIVPFDSAQDLGRISAGLIAGLRTAVALRESADSLELVLVSPLAAEELDQATDSVRALWPAGIRLVSIAGRADSARPVVVELLGGTDDPLRLALPAGRRGESTVRIARRGATGTDSAWVRAAGGVLLLWPDAGPVDPVGTGSVRDRVGIGPVRDTIGAVSAGDVVLVAPFARGAPLAVPPSARIVARWVDGEPAATETAASAGCFRTVAIPVPSRGDLVLDPRLARLVAWLTGPCEGHSGIHPIDSTRRAALAGAAGSSRVAAASLGRSEQVRSPLMPWLLGGALGLGLGELWLRRRRTTAAAGAVA